MENLMKSPTPEHKRDQVCEEQGTHLLQCIVPTSNSEVVPKPFSILEILIL